MGPGPLNFAPFESHFELTRIQDNDAVKPMVKCLSCSMLQVIEIIDVWKGPVNKISKLLNHAFMLSLTTHALLFRTTSNSSLRAYDE